jgi:hypothetical protein
MKCPKCKKNDQVKKVSVVLDEGSSSSNTIGLSIPLNKRNQNYKEPIYLSGYNTQSATGLVQRLSPPNKPRWRHFKFYTFFWIHFMPIFTFFSVFNLENPDYSNWSDFRYFGLAAGSAIVIGLFTLTVVGFAVELFAPKNKAQLDWDNNLYFYRESYFCFRDDICFNKEFYDEPVKFKNHIFSQTYI